MTANEEATARLRYGFNCDGGSRHRTLPKLLLAREMIHHVRALAILPPRPAFRDVILVFKVQHHLVLMPNRDAAGAAAQKTGPRPLYLRCWDNRSDLVHDN